MQVLLYTVQLFEGFSLFQSMLLYARTIGQSTRLDTIRLRMFKGQNFSFYSFCLQPGTNTNKGRKGGREGLSNVSLLGPHRRWIYWTPRELLSEPACRSAGRSSSIIEILHRDISFEVHLPSSSAVHREEKPTQLVLVSRLLWMKYWLKFDKRLEKQMSMANKYLDGIPLLSKREKKFFQSGQDSDHAANQRKN